jgi:mRNA interferase MazF
MKRAEVWWVDLPSPVGSRPAVILTRDAVLDTIGSIVVAIVTRTERGLDTEVHLGRREGLPRPCVASLDNILTVPRRRFVRLLGSLSRERVNELDAAISLALGLQR